MTNCKTCKYWDKKTPLWEDLDSFYLCTRIKLFADIFDWNDNYESRVLIEEYKDIKAVTCDGSDYKANLFTKEDFYCAEYSKVD